SSAGIDFVDVNGHYIDAPAHRPNDWEMKNDALAFMKIDGRHTGENLGNGIYQVIERYGLERKT
ncbi:hypothetical protein GGX14DRAFT_301016, partial [Mycena pura]